jgi:hypothetical protein
MTFEAKMNESGFTRVAAEKRIKRLTQIAPHGDSQWRNDDGVILSISNGALYHDAKRGCVVYYDAPGIVLNAVVVPEALRRCGRGRYAVMTVVDATVSCGVALYLEPCQIARLPGNKTAMKDSDLAAWYLRLDFMARPPVNREDCVKYRTRVMYWPPAGTAIVED